MKVVYVWCLMYGNPEHPLMGVLDTVFVRRDLAEKSAERRNLRVAKDQTHRYFVREERTWRIDL